jgi:hypothetical protein
MLHIHSLKKIAMSVAALAAVACANPPTAETPTTVATTVAAAPAAPKPLEISEASFRCIRDMKAVRGFYVDNLLGNVDATLAAAMSANGAVYPAGSIVQLVPGEAMVKHHPGYNAATNDWEFFELDALPSGTKIRVRGATDVVNQFGGNCLSCHVKAEPKWDMICEQGHGCDPIPLTPVMTRAIQNTDPRCGAMELPDDQKAALQQLMAFRAAAAAAAQKPAEN